jgi:hypothetical protein
MWIVDVDTGLAWSDQRGRAAVRDFLTHSLSHRLSPTQCPRSQYMATPPTRAYCTHIGLQYSESGREGREFVALHKLYCSPQSASPSVLAYY